MSLITALPLAAVVICSSSEETTQQPPSSETTTSRQTQRPCTTTVGDHDATVQSQPERIVVLSTEAADLAPELVGPERIIAATKSIFGESSGNQVGLAHQVPNAIANSTKPDPEQILSYELDMVLMISRHDQEQSTSELLGASDVLIAVSVNSDPASPRVLTESVTKLGELLGVEDKAVEMVAKTELETEEILSEIDSVIKPKTLVLFTCGGQKMTMGV